MGELLPNFLPGGNIVDVGCGAGDYLATMKHLGWRTLGIEPDPISAEIAKGLGLEIKTGTLTDAHLPDSFYDLITMRHVVEHLHDPVAVIKESFRILKNGGKLVLVTPNNRSLAHTTFRECYFHLDPPRHLMVFSPKSIALLIQKLPFTEVHIKTLSRAAVGSYNASTMIRDHKQLDFPTIHPQRGQHLFHFKEVLFNAFGKECGEEIEVVAIK
jgi:SAM-dependent methyltransferase